MHPVSRLVVALAVTCAYIALPLAHAKGPKPAKAARGGVLVVSVEPPELAVTVDGTRVDPKTLGHVEVAAGAHVVAASGRCHEAVRSELDVKAGETKAVALVAPRAQAEIR